jgi:hypothetical protein
MNLLTLAAVAVPMLVFPLLVAAELPVVRGCESEYSQLLAQYMSADTIVNFVRVAKDSRKLSHNERKYLLTLLKQSKHALDRSIDNLNRCVAI